MMGSTDSSDAGAHVLLADGQVVELRALTGDDAAELRRLHAELPAGDLRSRFLGVPSAENVARLLGHLLAPGDGDVVALGVFRRERLIGVGHFEVLADPALAEVAFVVEHDVHAKGVATLLLEHLAFAAARRGVRGFTAEVLTTNTAMLRVFLDSGLHCLRTADGSVTHVVVELDDDASYSERRAARDRAASAESLRHLLAPRSVAVVGASASRGKVGNAVLRNLLAGGYRGAVYPINPSAAEIEGVAAFPDVSALPEAPELAVLCVPASAVPEVAERCGRRGVRALVVVSSGLGGAPARELVSAVRRWGMRLLGPNCFGAINSDPDVRLDATFGADGIPPGDVGIVTQSGGVGIVLLSRLRQLGLGVSTLVSAGDKYDVSGNDLLQWWDADERTGIGVVYLESFGNPRKFSWSARHLGRAKPLVLLRGGASPVARRAAAAHSSSTAAPEALREALLRQAGIIGADDVDEVLAVLAVRDAQGIPRGGRVAVVTNAGGLGVLTAEACARAGLDFAELHPATRAELAGLLPRYGSVVNPVDTTAVVDASAFARCAALVRADPNVDAVLVPLIETALGEPVEALADALANSGAGDRTPVVVVRPGRSAPVEFLRRSEERLPSLASPASAAAALAGLAGYQRWRERSAVPAEVPPDVDVAAARRRVVALSAFRRGGGWLSFEQTRACLEAVGVRLSRRTTCETEREALAALGAATGPVVVTALTGEPDHEDPEARSRGDVADADQLRAAWRALRNTAGAEFRGVSLRDQVAADLSLSVTAGHDESFGPVLGVGLGGAAGRLAPTRGHRLVPLSAQDAADLAAGPAATAVLGTGPGAAPDRDALVELLVRIARFAEAVPELVELELDPVLLRRGTPILPEARMRIGGAVVEDPLLRRLAL
ncbi:GNAT family N-acetyltransferase [Saccharopolyspora sp. MS10]|uniref:bifunctional acetate--CoA ligase family protein/GNAT family N-acetyltransferase n=1 Tax=Saccharopolyspora sp. MS10 TaxID=3385973 RepID=UPI0039A38E19